MSWVDGPFLYVTSFMMFVTYGPEGLMDRVGA